MISLKEIKAECRFRLKKFSLQEQYYYDYKCFPREVPRTFCVHRKGFSLMEWNMLGLEDKDYKSYLTTRDYYKLHPLNGRYSRLIDDKIVIKETLSGTPLDQYMPEYYFLFDNEGLISLMMDAPDGLTADVNGILSLLRQKKKLALKRTNSTFGRGFYKLEYTEEGCYVNSTSRTEAEIREMLAGCRNYVVTEYLTSHPGLQEFWPHTANAIRYLSGRVGSEWRMLKSFVRMGSSKTGEIESFSKGGVICYIDEEGFFHNGFTVEKKKGRSHIREIRRHPDTKKVLEGRIPCWEELVKAAEDLQRYYSQTCYLGFDFVVTDENKIKLLEINSLNSLYSIQMDRSILDTENGKWFFLHKLKKDLPALRVGKNERNRRIY